MTDDTAPQSAEFRETQPFWRNPAISLFVGGLTLFNLYGVVQQIGRGRPFGTSPAPDGWLIGITLTVPLLLLVHLMTYIGPEGLWVRYPPMPGKHLQPDDIARVEHRHLGIAAYGGRGFRIGLRGERAYLVRSGDAIAVITTDGREIVVGTRDPEAFLAALREIAPDAEYSTA